MMETNFDKQLKKTAHTKIHLSTPVGFYARSHDQSLHVSIKKFNYIINVAVIQKHKVFNRVSVILCGWVGGLTILTFEKSL